MKIGILGTGPVGRTLASKLIEVGQEVMLGTRDPDQTMARSEPGPYGALPFAAWFQQTPGARLGNYRQTAQFAPILINATNGSGSIPALEQAGAANLEGKILIDLSNPLDFSKGMPPTLTICNTDSLGEQIQRAFPGVKVVKTLNTLTADLMVNPGQLMNGEHDLFLSGNDAQAKAEVARLLQAWFGWKHILDLGDITTARGTEMYLPLWLRLWGALGTAIMNIRVVR